MHGGAINYVEQWVMENVHFTGHPQTQVPDPEAVSLTKQCVDDASGHGFTQQDLENVVGNLPTYIHRCIVIRADQHVLRTPFITIRQFD